MQENYKIITLCGSTKFKDEFLKTEKDLTLQGNIVISVGLFGHAGDVFTDEQKIMLDDMHKRKIDMADEIFVINKSGYIGSSTKSEIKYAIRTRKKVVYLEQPEVKFPIPTKCKDCYYRVTSRESSVCYKTNYLILNINTIRDDCPL